MKKWKNFELLVEKIYKELEPNAVVTQDDKIEGYESKIKRQIDVSIRDKIAGVNILIIVQAKDYKDKVDVNEVGNFATVIKDVKASKGVMICNMGFTKGAQGMAESYGIDLFSAHDVNLPRWKIDYNMPVLVRQIKLKIEFKFKGKVETDEEREAISKLNSNPWEQVFSKDRVNELESPLTVFAREWNSKKIEIRPGKNVINFVLDENDLLFVKCDNKWIRVLFYDIFFDVEESYWIKKLKPIEFRTLKNLTDEELIISHVEVDENELRPSEEDGWIIVKDFKNIPIADKHFIFYMNTEIISEGEEWRGELVYMKD